MTQESKCKSRPEMRWICKIEWIPGALVILWRTYVLFPCVWAALRLLSPMYPDCTLAAKEFRPSKRDVAYFSRDTQILQIHKPVGCFLSCLFL